MDSRDSAFGALLTLVTNRRCYVAPEVPITVEGDSKALLIPVAPSLDPSLNAPMPAWEDVEREARQNLARIASLRDEDAATISAAMHMHYCAALLASQDIAGAHAIAVGGLETLAQHFGSPPQDWREWDKAQGWDTFIKENGLSAQQGDALRTRLMADAHIRLAETFAAYVSQRLPDDFWNEDIERYVWQYNPATGEDDEGDWAPAVPRSVIIPTDRQRLKSALKKTYSARSTFIHVGKRTVTHGSEILSAIPGIERDLLSFADTRTILRQLILLELADRGSDDFPGVKFEFTD